jgi:type IV pilus assembly protein PilA
VGININIPSINILIDSYYKNFRGIFMNYIISNKKKSGFTIVELIIVIAVIAILAVIAIPKFGEIRETANKKSDIGTAKNVAAVIESKIASGELSYYRNFTNGHKIDEIPNLTLEDGDTWTSQEYIDITQYLDGGKTEGTIKPKTDGAGEFFLMAFTDNTVKIYTGGSEDLITTLSDKEVYPEQTDEIYK